jgi:hypothetical protein
VLEPCRQESAALVVVGEGAGVDALGGKVRLKRSTTLFVQGQCGRITSGEAIRTRHSRSRPLTATGAALAGPRPARGLREP